MRESTRAATTSVIKYFWIQNGAARKGELYWKGAFFTFLW